MKKKTHDEFIEEMKVKNPTIKVLGQYTNNKTHIDVECLLCGRKYKARPDGLMRGKACTVCSNKQNGLRNRKTNEQFVKELNELGTGIKTCDNYVTSRTMMEFICQKQHSFRSTPHDILAGYGCPYCAGNKVKVGYNDLWTTRPQVAKQLLKPEEGYTVSRSSHKVLEFVCPNCGEHKSMTVKQMCDYGLACGVCSDGISYPNKFSRVMMKQLPVENIRYEWQPDWLKPYFYDTYFEYQGKKYVLEMDGALGHGEVAIGGGKDVTGIARDKLKDGLAFDHEVTVIRVDCKYRYENLENRYRYVKNNILQSKLNELFDMNVIDFDYCNTMAQKSIKIKVAKMYDSGMAIREISNEIKYAYGSIYRWLKELANYGLCSYTPQDQRRTQIKKDGE